ncbi:L-methionine/branched-chain amino acid transporter [Vibrio sp. MA40-2]|uniref:L-methionine/branched-chain amino acid transporter n=1 Tax=Vibrio sp. MA40-2 TaxID=3391828 RepID=UPI0039A6984D
MGELKKEITLWSGLGQLSTTLLGTGLFMIPAIAAGIAGEASLWAWLILFIAVIPIALTFAALGKRYPSAGGTAFFVRKAFGAKLERSVGWLFLSVTPVGIPAAVALAGSFGQQLLPNAINQSLSAELITIGLLVTVNLVGSKSSARLQTIIALAICALVSLFWIYGDVSTNDIHMPPLTTDSVIPIASALGVMFWCFVGIEAFAHMGEEFKNPETDFPLAIILGCLFAGAIYWCCSVIILKFQAYGTEELASGSIPWISEQIFGSKGAILISIVGYFACFASLNLYVQSLSRMAYAIAKNNHPNSKIASVSKRGVPVFATLSIACILTLSALIGEVSGIDLEMLVKLANGVFVLVYLLAMLAAYKLLNGINRVLSMIALVITVLVFACLGWASLYALIVLFCVYFSVGYLTNTKVTA